jgi:myosin heavy subunit
MFNYYDDKYIRPIFVYKYSKIKKRMNFEFEDVLNAMRVLNFSEGEKHEVFKLVTGVLYFGNIKFNAIKSSTADEASEVANMDALSHACNLWGVSADIMKNVFIPF